MGKAWSLGVARTTTWWCSRCGVSVTTAPRSGASASARCAFCHRQGTHVAHQRERAMSQVPTSSPPPGTVPVPTETPGELPASYPRVCGSKKRALLVGVSYTGTKYELKGTVTDVKQMRRLLCGQFGFPDGCILELTEQESDPYRVPTRANLLLAMRWLVEGASAGDSLVFHFSGHGVQKLDFNDDEVDGYNEALCPVDFERGGAGGKILDDEINEAIVRPLGKGVKLHAIVDTCHSGTILDLPYLCRMSRTGYWQWENHCHPSRKPKRPSGGGLAISISGCSDDQKSVDSSSGLSDAEPIGAMTDSFIKAVQAEPGTTYGRLLSAMRARIRDGHGNPRLPGRLGSFVRQMMVSSSSVQEPQLCSSEVFDIYRKPFLL